MSDDRLNEARIAQVGEGDVDSPATRALAEAEARRKAAADSALPAELGGRDGLEPTRYGDWEKGGLAVDF